MKIMKEEFQVHEVLNPKLWNQTTKKLLPEVRKKIIDIVSSFESFIQVPIDILDVQLVGSNASYNYTESSDLDVHIIANFDVVGLDKELLLSLYNAKKAAFNKEMNILLRGIEIEIYVQDVKSNTISNGIYSVCDDEWVKEPKPIKSITKHNVEKELSKWKQHIDKVLITGSYEDINNVINSLYLMRSNAIAVDGEYAKGNEIFKTIRSNGWLSNLKDALNQSLSKKLSLESMTKGQLVDRFDE